MSYLFARESAQIQVQSVRTDKVLEAPEIVLCDDKSYMNDPGVKDGSVKLPILMEKPRAKRFTAEEAVDLTAHMKSGNSLVRGRRTGGKKTSDQLKNAIVSKAFNIVAARPISRVKNPMQEISVSLSSTFRGLYNSSTTVDIVAGSSFTLANFAGSTALLTVFDQYKIDKLEVWLEPAQSQSTVMTSTGSVVTAVDIDDGSTPLSFANVKTIENSLTTEGTVGHYHHWVPRFAIGAYTGTFGGYAQSTGWIDSGSPNVQHYGLKFATTSTSTVISYTLEVRAWISFRNPGIA